MRISGPLAGYVAEMEYESTLHGPREDDELARNMEGLVRGAPVEPRSKEDRRFEDPDDNTLLDPGGRPETGDPGALSEHEIEERAELARLLTGVHYPATEEELIDTARRNGAEEDVLARLFALPEGRFEVFEEIWEALGGEAG